MNTNERVNLLLGNPVDTYVIFETESMSDEEYEKRYGHKRGSGSKDDFHMQHNKHYSSLTHKDTSKSLPGRSASLQASSKKSKHYSYSGKPPEDTDVTGKDSEIHQTIEKEGGTHSSMYTHNGKRHHIVSFDDEDKAKKAESNLNKAHPEFTFKHKHDELRGHYLVGVEK